MEDTSRSQAALNLLRSLDRLTVTRFILEEAPFAALREMLEALMCDKLFEAERCYHAMTQALMNSAARRVSGNLLIDYILYVIIERENAFSLAAAKSFIDTPVYSAMRVDLAILINIGAKLNTPKIKIWLEEASGQKHERPKDDINEFADAVWGGTQPRLIKRPKVTLDAEKFCASNMPNYIAAYSCFPWNYGEFELRDSYVSDAALEEIYLRCMETDRHTLVDDLWNFFESYGTGVFLRYRAFEYCDANNTLFPITPPFLTEEENELCLFEHERELLLENTISFMRYDNVNNVMFCGGGGLGKTSTMFYLINQLPEVRLVVTDGKNACQAMRYAFEKLKGQPLKFLLFIDDADNYLEEIEDFISSMRVCQPANVLVYCAVKKPRESMLFPVNIKFDYPDADTFALYLRKRAEAEGMQYALMDIINACMDYTLETKLPLSYHAVRVIMKMLQNKNEV